MSAPKRPIINIVPRQADFHPESEQTIQHAFYDLYEAGFGPADRNAAMDEAVAAPEILANAIHELFYLRREVVEKAVDPSESVAADPRVGRDSTTKPPNHLEQKALPDPLKMLDIIQRAVSSHVEFPAGPCPCGLCSDAREIGIGYSIKYPFSPGYVDGSHAREDWDALVLRAQAAEAELKQLRRRGSDFVDPRIGNDIDPPLSASSAQSADTAVSKPPLVQRCEDVIAEIANEPAGLREDLHTALHAIQRKRRTLEIINHIAASAARQAAELRPSDISGILNLIKIESFKELAS